MYIFIWKIITIKYKYENRLFGVGELWKKCIPSLSRCEPCFKKKQILIMYNFQVYVCTCLNIFPLILPCRLKLLLYRVSNSHSSHLKTNLHFSSCLFKSSFRVKVFLHASHSLAKTHVIFLRLQLKQ